MRLKLRSKKVGRAKVARLDLSGSEVHAAQVGPMELRVVEVRKLDEAAAEVRVGRVDVLAVCADEVRARKVGTGKIHIRKVGALEVGSSQSAVTQVKTAKVEAPERFSFGDVSEHILPTDLSHIFFLTLAEVWPPDHATSMSVNLQASHRRRRPSGLLRHVLLGKKRRTSSGPSDRMSVIQPCLLFESGRESYESEGSFIRSKHLGLCGGTRVAAFVGSLLRHNAS